MVQWTRIFMQMVVRDERGATAIEYSLLAALIAVAFFAGAQALGLSLNNLFNNLSTFLAGVQPPP